MTIKTRAMALGVAGAVMLGGAFSASAGPIPAATSAIKGAVSDHVDGVRWRGRGVGPGLAFGLAAGALVGAAVAGRPYYEGPDYYDGGPLYAAPYAYGPPYAPGYYGHPAYGLGFGKCVTDEGYGRVRPCDAR